MARTSPGAPAGSLGRSRRCAACLLGLALGLGVTGPRAASAQEGVVAGVVVEAQTQRPLPGAQVAVRGQTVGAMVDAAGRFRITGVTGPRVTLEIVMLGFRTLVREVAVGATDLRLALSETAINLDEIVVTGTPGGTERRAIGNSVSSIDAAEVTEVAPVQSVQQLLSGRVAGVAILPGSGNVGTGAVTRIRGMSTLSLTNEPLIYVDGVRVDNNPRAGPSIRQGRQVSRINDFNPEDIARIEVIKGPAAATLYGTEASNGVIQIFTKRGSAGEPTFDAVVRQGVNWFMDPEGRLPTVYGRDSDTGEIISLDLYDVELAAGRPIFQKGPIQGYGLSVRGGTDMLRYYLSGEWDDEEGIVDYNWSQRGSARANVHVTVSEQLDVRTSFGYVRNRTRLAQASSGWDLMAQFVWGSPSRADGPTRGFLRAPPEAVATIESIAEIDRTTWSVQANHQPVDWFSQRLTGGLDVGDALNSILIPRHPEGSNYFFGGQSLGEKSVERVRNTFATLEYSANASLDVTADLNSTTSVGAQYYAKQNLFSSASGRVFPAPGVETVGGAAVTFGGEDQIENKTVGVFVQEQAGWRNRLFLTGALRADDNSAFGENFDLVIYPKLSATWVVNEEPFWNVPFVDALKLRAAWGRAGQQPDVFAAAQLYEPSTGPGDASTLTPQNIGNPDLKPEVAEELEIGFDAGLLEDRVGLGFTYYRQRTRDAIVEQPVTPSLGFPGSQFVNVGEINNSGFELSVDAEVLRGEDIGATLALTLATNDNEVEDLGGLPPIIFGRQRHQVGYPVAGFFQRVVVSSDVAADGTVTNVLCRGGPDPADPVVPCADAPSIFTGRSTPAWQGTVSATLSLFESLRLYGMVDYRGGFYIENGDIGAAHVLLRNTLAIHEAQDPILMGNAQIGEWQRAGFMDAGFAKLREVSAAYTFPTQWIEAVGASHASLTVAGRNLATLWQATDEIWGVPVIDPEIRSTSSESSGYVQTVMPQYAQVLTTLRVSF